MTYHHAIVQRLELVCGRCGAQLERACKDERGRYPRAPFVDAAGNPSCVDALGHVAVTAASEGR